MHKKNIVNIALDCMGGDNAPKVIVAGASLSSKKLQIDPNIILSFTIKSL